MRNDAWYLVWLPVILAGCSASIPIASSADVCYGMAEVACERDAFCYGDDTGTGDVCVASYFLDCCASSNAGDCAVELLNPPNAKEWAECLDVVANTPCNVDPFSKRRAECPRF